jgi:hypothetical protein
VSRPLTFASCVDHPITQHKTTRTTHQVATGKLFDDVGIRISTVGTDESNGEVGPEGCLGGRLDLSEWKGLSVSHSRE